MSTITFQCTSCDADYELEIPQLLEKTQKIKCPNCGTAPTAGRSHAFLLALEELLSCMAGMRSKVHFELNLDTEELPPPFGVTEDAEGGGLTSFEDDEDEDFEDEDFEEEEDELDGFQEEDFEEEDF